MINRTNRLKLVTGSQACNTIEKPMKRRSSVAWTAVFLLTAWMVTHFFLHFCGSVGNSLNHFPASNLDGMVDGRASRPYVGRMLVPMVIQGTEAVLPLGARRAIVKVAQNPYWIEEFDGGPVDFRSVFYCVLAFGMFIGVGFGARNAFKVVYDSTEITANIAGVLYLAAVPMWFRYIGFIYDPATILLGTWIVYAIAAKKPWLTVALFALACINKETAPLLIPVIFMGLGKSMPRLAGFTIVLSAALIQLFRMLEYGDNPGSTLEFHLLDHQAVLYRYPMSVLWAAFALGTFIYFAKQDWSDKPKLLKIGAAWTFIPLFAASIPFGFVDEIRALFDAYPFIAMLAIPTVLKSLSAVQESPHERYEGNESKGEDRPSPEPCRAGQAV